MLVSACDGIYENSRFALRPAPSVARLARARTTLVPAASFLTAAARARLLRSRPSISLARNLVRRYMQKEYIDL